MKSCIGTLNIGSSSIKLDIYEADSLAADAPAAPLLTARLSELGNAHATLRWGSETGGEIVSGRLDDALASLLRMTADRLDGRRLVAVGHRIVHGGQSFQSPAFLNERALQELEALTPLAPQHQPANLLGVRAAMEIWPRAMHVGCFDTGFHRTQPHIAELYGLPRSWADEGLIRYGFHGLSYAHVAATLARQAGAGPHRRVVAAHLGAGSSMCAMLDGRSIATTMGFTALDGLPMATRCGELDPGLVLYLIEQRGMAPHEVRDMLYRKSGLLGLSGISGDMRTLLASDEPEALTAVEYYCYRARREIGSLAAALGGLDTLVFTGGVGENAAPVRAAICAGLRWLGVDIDEAANETGQACISGEDSPATCRIVPANEEWVIARGAYSAVAV